MSDMPRPPVDGLTKPAPPPSPSDKEGEREEGKSMPSGNPRVVQLSIPVLAGVYVLFGFVLLTLFPTIRADLQWLRSVGMLTYLFGLMVWLGAGAIAALRVMQYKTTNVKMKMNALMRIGAVTLPALFVSILVLAALNREPSLRIDILSPAQGQLAAPVSVTFGTETARRYLAQKGLVPRLYRWDFNGNGQIDQETTEPQITADYYRSNIYRVSVIVELTNGERRTLTTTLNIPREVFAVAPLQPVIGQPATFSLEHLYSPQDFVRADWDFDGDGVVDISTTSMTATHTYHRLGEFQPRVTVSLSNNSRIDITHTVQVVEPVPLPFPVTMTSLPGTLLGTAPFGVIFTIETQEPVAQVTWTFGSEGSADGMIAPFVFNRIGVYPVTATVRSQSGAVARLTQVVQVTQPLSLPDLRFRGTPEVRSFRIVGEQPLTVNITPETSRPLVTFKWDVDGASEVRSTDETLSATFRTIGETEVELVAIDAEQKVMRRKITVVVNPPQPIISINIDPVTPDAPSTVRFDATDTFIPGKEITGYEWDFGVDRVIRPLGAQAEFYYERPGTYQIRLRVKTTDGSTYEERRVLVVRAPVKDACFLPSRTSGQAPAGIRFDTSCSTDGFVSWLWDFGDGSSSEDRNPVHVYLEPGEYTVRLEARDAQNTLYTQSATITITEP